MVVPWKNTILLVYDLVYDLAGTQLVLNVFAFLYKANILHSVMYSNHHFPSIIGSKSTISYFK